MITAAIFLWFTLGLVVGFGLCAVMLRVGQRGFLAKFSKDMILGALRLAADRLDEARRQGVPFEDALAMMRETVDEMEADEILDAQIDAVVRTS